MIVFLETVVKIKTEAHKCWRYVINGASLLSLKRGKMYDYF